ncbi:MAG TPA: NAD-dependent epimerase/dehydratase family protein [Stenotrophomonas sp.]|jgi:uncharacterized protein YbjT (DUF2867 family)
MEVRVKILGSGLVASAFKRNFRSDKPVCVFARGVSNSSETLPAAFAREAEMLNASLADSPFLLYFSSCALIGPNTQDSPYFAHKRQMEAAVLAASPHNRVLRLPQVVGSTFNPNTLPNFLFDRISREEPFTVWSLAERNLIDADDIAKITSALVGDAPAERTITVAAARSLSMPDIVKLFERVLQKRAHFTLEHRGTPLPVNNDLCLRVAARLGIDLGETYPERVIRKYYGR